MFKKTLILTAMLAANLAHAADYLVVVPVKGRTATAPQDISVALNAYSVPAGQVGAAYPGFDFKTLLQVTGDASFNAAAATWAVTGGALPAGLLLSASGVLSGTPTATGSSSFQVTATYRTKTGLQTYQVNIADMTVSLASTDFPTPVMGQNYSATLASKLTVNGGTSFDANQVTWSIASGTLPAGVSLTAGSLTGVVLDDAPSSFVLSAQYGGKTTTQSYSFSPTGTYSLILDGEDPSSTSVFTNRAPGGVAVTKYGNVANTNSQSKVGSGSIYFDGSGDYLLADGAFSALTTKTAPFTMEAWVYPTMSGDLMIFGCNHNLANVYNQFLVGTASLNLSNVVNNHTTSVPLNVWSHVAATYDGSVAKVYLNGSPIQTRTFAMPNPMSGCVLGIGAEFDSANGGTPGNYFKGYMDQIKYTPNLVKYTGSFTPPTR